MAAANRFLRKTFIRAHNRRFCVPAAEQGSAFVPFVGPNLSDILCLHEERVGTDNTVRYDKRILQIPQDTHRSHYVRANVRVHEYPDATLAIFHGPRCLAHYDAQGKLLQAKARRAA